MLRYDTSEKITAGDFVDLLARSGLAERRPVDDDATMEGMVANADLMVTAWDGEKLVGVARSVTDFTYCCYLSDLAVDRDYQKQGIGEKLMGLTRANLGPRCKVILLAAPAAAGYYPKIGFRRHDSAWTLP